MKQISWSAILVMTIFLTACGSSASIVSTPTAPVVPEVSSVVDVPAGVVVASAKVIPAQVSNIGFTISALVKEVAVAEGDVVKAGQTLVVLDVPELEFSVLAANESLRAAQANLVTKNRDKYRYVDPFDRVFYYTVPNEVVQIEKQKVQQAQSSLDVAKANLAQNTIVAPYDGVVAALNIIPGELAQIDQAVLTLVNLDALQIKTTDLSERDIHQVQVGQTVNVFIEALNAHVTGKVIRISPISEVVGGDIVYPATIELDEQPEGLLWGMTAEVQIQTK